MKRMFPLLVALAVLVAAFVSVAPVSAAGDIDSAVSWLRGQQQPDGGYLGFSGGSDPGVSADVAVAFAAAGISTATVASAGPSLLDYLTTSAASYGSTTGGAVKLALAAAASGANPRSFGGVDLIDQITSAADPQSGLMDQQIYVHALAMLALSAAGEPIPTAAVTALTDRQIADGSWAFSGATEAGQGDSNTTAVAIQALVASGQGSSQAVKAGLGYLSTLTTSSGAITYQPGMENPPVGDSNSTSLGVQALIAAGGNASSAASALAGFQNPSGAFFFRPDAKDDNLLSTVQAIPALAEKPLPVRSLESGHTAGLPTISPQTGVGSTARPAGPVVLIASSLLLITGAGLRSRRSRRQRADGGRPWY